METETTDLVSGDMLQQIPAPAKNIPNAPTQVFQALCGIPPTWIYMTFFGLLNLCHWTTHEPRSWKGLICRAASEGVHCGSNQTNKRNKQTKREIDTHNLAACLSTLLLQPVPRLLNPWAGFIKPLATNGT